MQRMTGLEETFKNTNIHQHRVSHLPAISLREGVGQQDLALKELETMRRKTVFKETFIRLLFTRFNLIVLIVLILLFIFFPGVLNFIPQT